MRPGMTGTHDLQEKFVVQLASRLTTISGSDAASGCFAINEAAELAVRGLGGLRGLKLETDCRAQHVKTVGHSCTHLVLSHAGHEMMEIHHSHFACETSLREEGA